MSPWEFILYPILSIYVADLLKRLTIAIFNRIEIPWSELFERVFSWYVMLPAILSITIVSAILESVYLLSVPNLLLMATAYFHPIVLKPKETPVAQQPKETAETFENGFNWDDFKKALWTVQEVSKNKKSVNLLYVAFVAVLFAMTRNKDDDTRE